MLSVIEVFQRKQAYWWRGVVDTKVFILLKKFVVDVDRINDIPQFSLMLLGEE